MSERLGDGHGAIEELALRCDEVDAGEISAQGPQRERRLDRPDAAAGDDDMAAQESHETPD